MSISNKTKQAVENVIVAFAEEMGSVIAAKDQEIRELKEINEKLSSTAEEWLDPSIVASILNKESYTSLEIAQAFERTKVHEGFTGSFKHKSVLDTFIEKLNET